MVGMSGGAGRASLPSRPGMSPPPPLFTNPSQLHHMHHHHHHHSAGSGTPPPPIALRQDTSRSARASSAFPDDSGQLFSAPGRRTMSDFGVVTTPVLGQSPNPGAATSPFGGDSSPQHQLRQASKSQLLEPVSERDDYGLPGHSGHGGGGVDDGHAPYAESVPLSLGASPGVSGRDEGQRWGSDAALSLGREPSGIWGDDALTRGREASILSLGGVIGDDGVHSPLESAMFGVAGGASLDPDTISGFDSIRSGLEVPATGGQSDFLHIRASSDSHDATTGLAAGAGLAATAALAPPGTGLHPSPAPTTHGSSSTSADEAAPSPHGNGSLGSSVPSSPRPGLHPLRGATGSSPLSRAHFADAAPPAASLAGPALQPPPSGALSPGSPAPSASGSAPRGSDAQSRRRSFAAAAATMRRQSSTASSTSPVKVAGSGSRSLSHRRLPSADSSQSLTSGTGPGGASPGGGGRTAAGCVVGPAARGKPPRPETEQDWAAGGAAGTPPGWRGGTGRQSRALTGSAVGLGLGDIPVGAGDEEDSEARRRGGGSTGGRRPWSFGGATDGPNAVLIALGPSVEGVDDEELPATAPGANPDSAGAAAAAGGLGSGRKPRDPSTRARSRSGASSAEGSAMGRRRSDAGAEGSAGGGLWQTRAPPKGRWR